MTNGIYIFKNPSDFITVLLELSNQKTTVNKSIVNLNKQLNTMVDIEKEIALLNNYNILVHTGFKTHKLIKCVVVDSDNVEYHINYSFKDSFYFYSRLLDYFRKRENIYI